MKIWTHKRHLILCPAIEQWDLSVENTSEKLLENIAGLLYPGPPLLTWIMFNFDIAKQLHAI